jgi:hypothetical protein
MIVILLVLLVIAVGGLVAVLWLRRPDRWLNQRMARRVVVHTSDNQSIEGLLTSVAPDGLVLGAAIYLDSGAEPVQLGGDIWVPRNKVALIQIKEPTNG